MITVKCTGNIYTVTETLHSFVNTKITNWYYDMENLLISEDRNFPDNMQTRKLTEKQIIWFNTYYKPKMILIGETK